MFKQILIILTVASLTFIACNNKTGTKTATTETPQTETPKEEEPQEESTETKPEPYVTVKINKTPCYGTCPVFKVKFYTDGRAEYNGKMNVDRVGEYVGQVDEKIIKSIRDEALKAGYFDFYNEYPTGDVKIADLPSTVTYLRIGDQEKTIVNKYQAPEALKNYEKFLLDLVEKVEWRKVKPDSNK